MFHHLSISICLHSVISTHSLYPGCPHSSLWCIADRGPSLHTSLFLSLIVSSPHRIHTYHLAMKICSQNSVDPIKFTIKLKLFCVVYEQCTALCPAQRTLLSLFFLALCTAATIHFSDQMHRTTYHTVPRHMDTTTTCHSIGFPDTMATTTTQLPHKAQRNILEERVELF